MHEGMLTINFDPPCLGFNNSSVSALTPCTSEDIYALLLQLGIELPPLRDCYVRIQGIFADEHLAKFHLLTDSHPDAGRTNGRLNKNIH